MRLPKRQRQDGQGLTEFALIMPIIVLILMGIFDFGRAVYAYNTIADAARTGGRVAIVDQDLDTDCTLVPVTAPCAAANQAVALGITADQVSINFHKRNLPDECSPPAIDCVAEVTVPYQFTAITPIIGNIIGPISMSSTTAFPIEHVSP
jgi:Flp pilus assembly protein TadG